MTLWRVTTMRGDNYVNRRTEPSRRTQSVRTPKVPLHVSSFPLYDKYGSIENKPVKDKKYSQWSLTHSLVKQTINGGLLTCTVHDFSCSVCIRITSLFWKFDVDLCVGRCFSVYFIILASAHRLLHVFDVDEWLAAMDTYLVDVILFSWYIVMIKSLIIVCLPHCCAQLSDCCMVID